MKSKITFGKILKTLFAGDQEILDYMNYFELESNVKKLVYKNGPSNIFVVYDRDAKVFYGLCTDLVWTEADIKLDSNVVVENLEMREYDMEAKKFLLKAFEQFQKRNPLVSGHSFNLETMNEMIQKDLKIATIAERSKIEQLYACESLYHERFSREYEQAANLLSKSGQFDILKDAQGYAYLGMHLAALKRSLLQYQVCCYVSEEENSIYLTDQNQIKEFGVEKISLHEQDKDKYVVCSYLKDAIRPIDQLIFKDEHGIRHINEDDILYFYHQLENFKLNHSALIEKDKKQEKRKGSFVKL